jgi:conjugative relaxase-like TrwC/TraI family protein
MAISIGKVRNGSYSKHLADTEKSGAAEYYKGEDVPSSWSGRGAEMQGLRGDVREEDLHAQLAGRVVDSGGARDMHAENPRRTEGFDLTVSAPKSVSIEALARDNKDALDAHREANREVLAELEKVAKARFTEAGKTRAEDTGNITVASYEHHGSVSGDPHLHTHNAVANLTFDAEGRARALDSREIYANVDRLREVYDSALEKALNGRGLATYRDEKGHTQLEGYTREAMREFSSRSDQMDRHLVANGREAASAKERELARQETRRGQVHEPRSREETTQAWQEKVEQTRGAGPALPLQEMPKEQVRAAERQEQSRTVSREEFRDAKWAVNAEKDARAKLETGAYRSEAHREELERRIERAEALRDNKQTHDLYVRAEKAVEKMGVRDPDAQREASTRERIDRSTDRQERVSKEEFAKAARTVNDMKDAQAKLHGGVYDSKEHKEKLEQRVAAGEKLKAEKPALFDKAEKSVERRGVRDPDVFEKARAQSKADWQTLKDADLAAKALKSDAGLAFGFGRKELSASDKQRMDVAFNSRGDKFYVDSAGKVYADKLQGRKEPKETYFKTEKGWAGGEKDYMLNAKGEVFVRGSGFAGGAQQAFADSLKVDGKGSFAKTWNSMIQRSVGAKWEKASKEDTKRIQREANAARKEFYNERIKLRDDLRKDVERATTAFAERPQEMSKALDTMREKGRDIDAPKGAVKDLQKGREMSRRKDGTPPEKDRGASAGQTPAGQPAGKTGREGLEAFDERAKSAAAQEAAQVAQRREQYEAWKRDQVETRQAETHRREDSSKGTEMQVASRVGSAALDQAAETGKIVAEAIKKQTPEEAAKAAAEAREKARVEQMREQGQEGTKDLVRQQATIESIGEAKGAGGDPDLGRREDEQKREHNKQIAQDQRGQDAYTRKEGNDAVLERREQRVQEDRTATAGGTAATGEEPAQEDRTAAAGGEAATGKEPTQRQPAESQKIQDLRERADLLAESVIRRDGANSADGKEARDFDARKATLDELSAFIEKHGSPAQKEEARFELMKRDQGRQSDEHRQNREKADREARERSEGKSFGSSYL